MNIAQCSDKIVKIINDYSISGNLTESSNPNRLDYSLRFNSLIDIAQKEVAQVKKIRRIKKISHNPVANQLGDQFNIVQFQGDNQEYIATGSECYYFEVDDVATITIVEESSLGVRTTLTTINHTTPVGQFTAYKGTITASNPLNDIIIIFSGTTVYNHRNRALYGYSFSTNRIPNYSEYDLYQMDDDFFQLVKVVEKGVDYNAYNGSINFYWENRNVLAIKSSNSSEYSVFYCAYPTEITDSTDPLTELEVDIEAQEAIPYHVAAHVLMDESGKASVSANLLSIYQGKLMNLDDRLPTTKRSVKNSLFRQAKSILKG